MISKFANGVYMFPPTHHQTLDPGTFTKCALVGEAASTKGAGDSHPRMLPGNRVMFHVKAHDARKVQIDRG